jgi:hypothetical protein
VNFSLGDIDYKGDETVTRGYSEVEETARVPLGDGVFMFATLEEDLEAPTRAGVALEDGVKVRIVAYNETTSAETSMEYTVMGGALTTNTAMTIETGNTYTFVAYSYNSTISPTYPATTITEAPTKDLLWGSVSKPITPTDNSVYITMNHVFTQIKMKATTTNVSAQPVIKGLTGVTVTPGNAVDLTIKTGAVAPNGADTQTVSTWNDMNTTTVVSDPILVYTGTANPIYVNISSVTIDGYLAFTGIQAAFKKALTAGYSYTLVVNFKKTIWAKSNIYWEWNDDADHAQGGYMTFDTQENGHQGYQGLLFRWGSLVGLSPALPAAFSSNVPVYKPDASEESGWTVSSYSSWGSVPYLSSGEINANQYASFLGDVCQYIGITNPTLSGYRLPTMSEFGNSGWVMYNAGSANLNMANELGTADLLSAENNGSYCCHSAMGVTLPTPGHRDYGTGGLFNVNYYGNYWSSDSKSNTAGKLLFRYGGVTTGEYSYRTWAYAVRCVRAN